MSVSGCRTSAGRDRLREDALCVSDVELEDDGGSADRWRGEHAHLGKLVGEMQDAVADPQLQQTSAARRVLGSD